MNLQILTESGRIPQAPPTPRRLRSTSVPRGKLELIRCVGVGGVDIGLPVFAKPPSPPQARPHPRDRILSSALGGCAAGRGPRLTRASSVHSRSTLARDGCPDPELAGAERAGAAESGSGSEVEDELGGGGAEDEQEQDAEGDGGAGPHGALPFRVAPSGSRVTLLPACSPRALAADSRSRARLSRP